MQGGRYGYDNPEPLLRGVNTRIVIPIIIIVIILSLVMLGGALSFYVLEDLVIVRLLIIIVTIFFLLGLYFLPAIMAYNNKINVKSIFIFNLFLGWTIVGWVIAMARVTKKVYNF